jgi:hypothetical protein
MRQGNAARQKTLQKLQTPDRFQNRGGSVRSLVAGLAAGAFHRLLDAVRGQDAETDGQAGLQADLGDAFGGFSGNVFKVGRGAADDRP